MDGRALVFCEGAFGSPQGKIANVLVRHSDRYDVLGVIDSRHAGKSACDVVDGASPDIPVFAGIGPAIDRLGVKPEYFVVGLDPDDGRLDPRFRRHIAEAIRAGMHVDSALSPYLHDDAEFPGLAMQSAVRLRSVGRPSPKPASREYSGEAAALPVFRIAVIGTNAVGGKIVTSVRLAKVLAEADINAQVLGTSTLAWFQGLRHTTVLDRIPQRHIAGELESLMLQAYADGARALIFEGRGGLLNAAHPCDLELLTTARPDAVILQHAPVHASIPGDDQFGLWMVKRHIRVIEAITGRPPAAVTLSHTERDFTPCRLAATLLRRHLNCLVTDVLADGIEPLAHVVRGLYRRGSMLHLPVPVRARTAGAGF